MSDKARIELLISDFPRFLRVFEQDPPFRRPKQLEYHLRTIRRIRKLGSTRKAIKDDEFLESLYGTLQAWGIGIRASRLKPFGAFVEALRARATDIGDL